MCYHTETCARKYLGACNKQPCCDRCQTTITQHESQVCGSVISAGIGQQSRNFNELFVNVWYTRLAKYESNIELLNYFIAGILQNLGYYLFAEVKQAPSKEANTVVMRRLVYACLFVQLALFDNAMTSQIQQINVKPIKNKRLNATGRDVIARASSVKCQSTCLQLPWCASANMAPDRSTCQLLSEEVSDVTSLESAEGWSYLRKYKLNLNTSTRWPDKGCTFGRRSLCH